MEIKQRKVCGLCRALQLSTMTCGLRYETKTRRISGIRIDAIPTEPCPKPMKVAESLEAYQNFTKR